MSKENNVGLVNRLLEQSFGEGWCNLLGYRNRFGGYWEIEESNYVLGLIGKKTKYGGFIIAGKFLDQDGSELMLFPEGRLIFTRKARRYALLYKQEMKVPVVINGRPYAPEDCGRLSLATPLGLEGALSKPVDKGRLSITTE